MGIADRLNTRDHAVLRQFNDAKEALSVNDIAEKEQMSQQTVRRSMLKLEQLGMLKGDWVKDDTRWRRVYYITGEGTRDFIRHLIAAREAIR